MVKISFASTLAGVVIGTAALGCGGTSTAPGTGVPLVTTNGLQYTASVSIGGQSFALDIDTGSTTTGVAASSCTTCDVTPLYTPGTTAVDDHQTAQTQFLDNTGWSGEIFTDQVTLGHGTPTVPLSFVAIKSQTGFFTGNTRQGVLGLGPDALLTVHTTSYLDATTTAGEADVIGVELCDSTGQLWIGQLDTTVVSSPVQFTPNAIAGTDPMYFEVAMTDIAMGGTSIGVNASTLGDTVVDTGTSLWYVPTAALNGIISGITHASAYATLFPGQTLAVSHNNGCIASRDGISAATIDAMMPMLAMTFGTGTDAFTITVPATRSYLYDSGSNEWCLTVRDNTSSGGRNLMGDTILRSMLTVIDIDANRIGFAPDIGCHTVEGDRIRAAPRGQPVELGHAKGFTARLANDAM